MLQLKPEGLDMADAISRPLSVCGRQLVADNSGALYWPSQRALMVADLHLGGDAARPDGPNGSAGAADGEAQRTLIRMAEVMDRYEPARVIVLGDGRRDGGAAAGPSAEVLQILRILQEDREWTWITGHDDRPATPQLGGRACAELKIAGIGLRRRPTPGWATLEIAASMRPAAHLSMYGYSLRRPCFVGNGRRLVMPVFAASSSPGMNVLDDAFRPLFGNGGMAVWLLGHDGLYPVATRFLAPD
jgi:metallophosphoesterase superfamily enzyme